MFLSLFNLDLMPGSRCLILLFFCTEFLSMFVLIRGTWLLLGALLVFFLLLNMISDINSGNFQLQFYYERVRLPSFEPT